MCDSIRRIGKLPFVLILTILIYGISGLAREQGSAPQNLVWAQEFLWTMFPDLRGHHYDLTTILYSSLDGSLLPMRRLGMQVGEAPQGTIFGYRGQGQILGYDAPTDVKPGPNYAKQFLITNFIFDKDGHLSSFVAGGPAAERPEAEQVARSLLELSQEWTDAQAVKELKKAGAMYGPAEIEKFRNTLPVGELDKLFGKTTVVSVEFKIPRDSEGHPYGPMQWLVVIRAKQIDGTQLAYKMIFEPFKGALTNMDAVSP
jgi:hypothetical protein